MARRWRTRLYWIMSIGMLAAGLSGCGSPHSIGNMPGPVQHVLQTPTLSGKNIMTNILTITGNQSYIGKGRIPGVYNYGPARDGVNNAYYVNFEIPVNYEGIKQHVGKTPRPIISSSLPTLVYIRIPPLANQAYDRLYFDPNTRWAPFRFKINANGSVIDESWDAVSVNS